MKIGVIGGTGLIGSQVVKILNASGHEAVPHYAVHRSGPAQRAGLARGAEGGPTIVDLNLTNTRRPSTDASLAFFQETMDKPAHGRHNAAGVGHAVILSIVGADQVPGLVYYTRQGASAGGHPQGRPRAVLDRSAPRSSSSSSTQRCPRQPTRNTVRLPRHARSALSPSADVAQAVADVSVGHPAAGHTATSPAPRSSRSTTLGKITLAAHGDHRMVVT